ncbi:hypothetical protein OIU85_001969 [Salix viminalis]|uniref:Uncharacterized protein n=1 Tax=Salix viminalis TaxID=40686 RepID=A0A9Q0VMI3_SALVM|nr:hypothetical protein OIU85_001969 [Salix viminalis]
MFSLYLVSAVDFSHEEIATELEVNFTLQVKLRVLLAQEGLIRRLHVSEGSSAAGRKLSKLNSNKEDTFGVPVQIFSPSHLSPSERKDLEQKG